MLNHKYLIEYIELMSEWDYEKNELIGISPESLSYGSHKKVWWRCKEGHTWQEQVQLRTKGYNCPYCAGKRPIVGVNDFATIHPEMLEEWDYSKNTILPSEILPSSGKKIWWKCKKGHSWIAKPNNRHRGTGCPVCSKEAQTSFPEMALFFYLSQCFCVKNRKKLYGKEVDIYIPEFQIAIEYNGIYYHRTPKVQIRDQEKKKVLIEKGICLLRVIESDKTYFDLDAGDFYVVYDGNYVYIQNVITNIIKLINTKHQTGYYIDVDVARDRISILNQYKSLNKQESISIKMPNLVNEWNYEKNGQLLPDYFTPQSRHIVWWKCSKGHEWQASIYSRNNGNGCPYCANQKILVGYNDLVTIAPSIAREWNHAKNGQLQPENVGAKTKQSVWWVCEKGHEWKAPIGNRVSGNNCPICANKMVVVGYNDFKTWCMQNKKEFLISEFDLEKNPFLPTEITPFGGQKVWWKCPYGHSYETFLTHRTQMGTACPYCSHKALLRGYNDLATTHPQIASQWDYDKNGDIRPSDVMAGSNKKKYWFICPQGHSYSATLLNRKKGQGCPQCYKENPRFSRKKRINVYYANDFSYYGSFEDAKALCEHLSIDYEKNYSNIGAVCRRKQKTLRKKYILRYATDDEFASLNEKV